jgi:replicative DNA helicase
VVEAIHNFDAERSVLGAVLCDPAALGLIDAILSPKDFFSPAHAATFEAMLALGATGQGIDVVALADELKSREKLAGVGGMPFLSALTDSLPTAAHIEQHAKIVAAFALRRRVADAAARIVHRANDPAAKLDEVLEFATQSLFAVTEQRKSSTVTTLDDGITKFFTRIEESQTRGGQPGIMTGFRDLDRMLCGMHDGNLLIAAGRPGTGKTSFALNVAQNVAAKHGPVLFASVEMPTDELVQRAMCAEARIDQQVVRSLQIGQEQFTAFASAAQRLYQLPIEIDDAGGLKLGALRSQARRMKRQRGLALVVVDYLQLMRGTERAQNREQEVSEISRGLKTLAKELHVPILCLSQLNRSTETRSSKDKRPQLSDLRESGAIEQDADVVMFIYRDELYNPQTSDRGVAEIIVAKQRNGPTDTVKLRFIRELTKFENLESAQTARESYYDAAE